MTLKKHLPLCKRPGRLCSGGGPGPAGGIAKPLHSLGLLEDMVVKIAGITLAELDLSKKCVVVFCAATGRLPKE